LHAHQFDALHKDSHLSATEVEAVLCDFEFALHHVNEAFRRWSEGVHALVGGEILPVQDVSVLQVLRMRDRPKTAAELAQALNREDTANVLYSLRKLERMGLIERLPDLPRRQTTYKVTTQGVATTDRYATVRRKVLLGSMQGLVEMHAQLEQATRTLTHVTGQYDYGARRLTMYRPVGAGSGSENDAGDQRKRKT
jgi:predicted MarR family transcription regulator